MTTQETQKTRQYMGSFSDSFLFSLNTWLQWISVLSIGLGLIAAIGLIFVSSESGRRQEQQLQEANRKIADLQPKPLKERLIGLLNAMDKTILPRLAAGQTNFSGVWNPAQFTDLQRLATEPGADAYIAFHSGPTALSNVATVMSASFELNPSLLKP